MTKKTQLTKTDFELHFLYLSLSNLLQSCAGFIDTDKVLSNAFQIASKRLSELLSEGAFGDIVEQYVVTVYEE